MRKFLIGALSLIAMTGFTAQAVNLPITYTPAEEGYTYPLGDNCFVEYQDNGNTYPNFYIKYTDFNSTKPEAAADGKRVISSANLTINVTGPNGFTWNGTAGVSTPFPGAEGHGYCAMGVITTAGTYNVDITATLQQNTETFGAEAKTITEKFTGSFVVPEQKPHITLSADLVKKDGDAARINYNVSIYSYTGTPTYLVELFDNADCTGTPVKTTNSAADGFDIPNLTPGTAYTYAVKATVTGDGLDGNLTETRVFNWTQEAIKPALNYTLVPTGEGCDIQYTIEPNGNPYQSVLFAALKGGEGFDTSASWHSTELSGTIHATWDGNGTQGVWLKAALFSEAAQQGTQIQCTHWDENITLSKVTAPAEADVVPSMTVTGFTPTSATSGVADCTITLTGTTLDLVKGFNIRISRSGDENMGVKYVEYPGNGAKTVNCTTEISGYDEGSELGIWPKVQLVYTNGSTGNWEQTNTNINIKYVQEEPDPELPEGVTVTPAPGKYEESPLTDNTITLQFTGQMVQNLSKARLKINGTEYSPEPGGYPEADADFNGKIVFKVNSDVLKDNGKYTCEFVPNEAKPFGEGVLPTFSFVYRVDDTTGVTELAGDEGRADFYTLEGVKVANPEVGKIYIKVANGKAGKILVK